MLKMTPVTAWSTAAWTNYCLFSFRSRYYQGCYNCYAYQGYNYNICNTHFFLPSHFPECKQKNLRKTLYNKFPPFSTAKNYIFHWIYFTNMLLYSKRQNKSPYVISSEARNLWKILRHFVPQNDKRKFSVTFTII